jgi:hypothetical protein
MEKMLAGNTSRGIARRQLSPGRPSAREVLKAVAEAHQIPVRSVLDRRNGEAFRHAVYLLRRRANLPLQDVAEMAQVSIGRVSQIQSLTEASEPGERLRRCLEVL